MNKENTQPEGIPRWIAAWERLPIVADQYPIKVHALSNLKRVSTFNGKCFDHQYTNKDFYWLEELPAAPQTTSPVRKNELEKAADDTGWEYGSWREGKKYKSESHKQAFIDGVKHLLEFINYYKTTQPPVSEEELEKMAETAIIRDPVTIPETSWERLFGKRMFKAGFLLNKNKNK